MATNDDNKRKHTCSCSKNVKVKEYNQSQITCEHVKFNYRIFIGLSELHFFFITSYCMGYGYRV